MSDSTHAGFSGPGVCVRITSESGRAFRSSVSGEADPLFQSRAVGVGQADSNGLTISARSSIFTSAASAGRNGAPSYALRLPPDRCAAHGVCQCAGSIATDTWSDAIDARPIPSRIARYASGDRPVSDATGVGQSIGSILTAVESTSPLDSLIPTRLWFPFTVAVGQKEPPLPSVRRAHIGRSKHVPFRSVPERGQGPENLSEGGSIPGRKKPRNVLQEDEAGSKFANDPRVFRPEPPLVFLRLAAPCERDRLTGEASADEVDGGEIAPPGESDIVNSASCAGPVSRED